jgi:hypothetical protein
MNVGIPAPNLLFILGDLLGHMTSGGVGNYLFYQI